MDPQAQASLVGGGEWVLAIRLLSLQYSPAMLHKNYRLSQIPVSSRNTHSILLSSFRLFYLRSSKTPFLQSFESFYSKLKLNFGLCEDCIHYQSEITDQNLSRS